MAKISPDTLPKTLVGLNVLVLHDPTSAVPSCFEKAAVKVLGACTGLYLVKFDSSLCFEDTLGCGTVTCSQRASRSMF